MTHVESFEARRLMTNTGLDATFGGDGGVNLPSGYVAHNSIGTKDGVFVDAYSGFDKARYLLKYTNDGTLDTTWGRRGRATLGALINPSIDASRLAYDVHSGAVYVGVLPRNRTADVTTMEVQRITANGKVDSAYGNDGVFVFTERADIQGLVPLLHNQLMIATERYVDTTPSNASFELSTSTTQIDLIRVTDTGVRDSTFGRRGVATVSTGQYTGNFGDFGGTETSERSTFSDLQLRSDGGYRVIETRNNHQYGESFGGNNTLLNAGSTNRVSVDSIVLSKKGVVYPGLTQNYGVSSAKTTASVPANSPGFYVPAYAAADGDGVVVVGGIGTSKLNGGLFTEKGNYATYPLYNKATVLRLSPGKRTLEALPLAGSGIVEFARGSAGTLIVRSGAYVQRFTSKLTLDRSWGGKHGIQVDDDTLLTSIDDAGRLIGQSGDGVVLRFDGSI